MTFGEIVRRFDVLYNNHLPYEVKLLIVYNFDMETFPNMYSSQDRKTPSELERSEPAMKFPYDDAYITLLAEHYFLIVNDWQTAYAMEILLGSYIDQYRLKHPEFNT